MMQNLVKSETPWLGINVKAMLGAESAGWVPVITALAVFMICSQITKLQGIKATGKLIGQKAPEFTLETRTADGKSEKKTLTELMAASPLPTLVDFYQNF